MPVPISKLKPFNQVPFDENTGVDMMVFHNWVLNTLNQLVGQASVQSAGVGALTPNTVNPTTSSFVSQGSRPQSIASPLAFTAVATGGMVTFYWDGTNGSTPLVIGRDDGTSISPIFGRKTVTGLTPGQTYFFYPFYQEDVPLSSNIGAEQVGVNWATVPGVAVGTPPIAFPAQTLAALQQQITRDHIQLATKLATNGVLIPASGSSSGSGGAGGGGGGGGGGGDQIIT